MFNLLKSPIIHIMTSCGRFYGTIRLYIAKNRGQKTRVFRLIKHPPKSLELPLVRHRDYDLEGVWDE